MKFIEINENWNFLHKWDSEYHSLPSDGELVDFPFDFMTKESRSYDAENITNSYYSEKTAVFCKWLPVLRKSKAIYVYIDGLCGIADLYINNVFVKNMYGARQCVDITEYYEYASRNMIRLNVTSPSKAGKYVGGGIAGSITLRTVESDTFVSPDSLFVHALQTDKVKLKIEAEIISEGGEYIAEACVFNAKGRRVCRKIKKLKLKKGAKVTELIASFSRAYPWTSSDSYIYSCVLGIYTADGAKVVDEVKTNFGIMQAVITPKGLKINNSPQKIKGAVLMPDNGLLGRASYAQAEEKKLALIKEIGYNAVRYIGCPTDAQLNAADKLGIMVVADLTDVWSQSVYPQSGHDRFEYTWQEDITSSVNALKNHPSVIMYSLGNNIPESYGRGHGYEKAARMAALVKKIDSSRLITVNAFELVPTRQEMESVGGKISKILDSSDDFVTSAISFGREKDMFKSLTMPFFESVDIAGYSFLHPRYPADKLTMPSRFILGMASYPMKCFDVFEEMERNANVIGDFSFCAVDFLGEPKGKPRYEDEPSEIIHSHASYCGDIDITLNRKPISYYKQVVLGDRSTSYITVTDPDERKPIANGYLLPQGKPCWNWPRKMGQNVTVEVYSGGDIVALYLDGKLIGRKLAGKINRNIATFNVPFYPGKLEAVSFHRGKEVGRTFLETVSAPRSLSISCPKTVKLTSGEKLCFVEISVIDKEGRLVPHAMRNVEVAVEGDGKLMALGNGDPLSEALPGLKNCDVFNGKLLAVLKADKEGKMSVKATSDGILSSKVQIKIR